MINDSFKRRLARTGLVVALAAGSMIALAATAATARAASITTHTTLATTTLQVEGRAVTAYSAQVVDENGAPASGVVTLVDAGRSLASATLDSTGAATIRYDGLTAGYHTLHVAYSGDSAHAVSQSGALVVRPEATTSPSFSLSIAPTSITIAAPGDSGALVATVTPAGGFTGFVSLSCSGPPLTTGAPGGSALPTGVSCVFTPANLEITSTTALTANMSLLTTSPAGTSAHNRAPSGARSTGSPLALAVLLPGIAGLGLLGRKRRLLSRAALLMLVGAVSLLGTTACSARYSYLNHGPKVGGTATGSYTLTITAQTSNGVTASSQSQSLALTVK